MILIPRSPNLIRQPINLSRAMIPCIKRHGYHPPLLLSSQGVSCESLVVVMDNPLGHLGHIILRVKTRMTEPYADYFGDIGGDLGQAKDGGLDACDVECLGGEGWGWGCFVAV